MKVLKKSKTLNGIDIQIEDWSENYPELCSYADTIAAYPPKIENPKDGFRLELRFNREDEALEAFKSLESGEKKLRDYQEEFLNSYHSPAKTYMEYKAG